MQTVNAVTAELTDESCRRAVLQLQAAAGPFFPSAARLITLDTGQKVTFMFRYFITKPLLKDQVEYELLTSVFASRLCFCLRSRAQELCTGRNLIIRRMQYNL